MTRTIPILAVLALWGCGTEELPTRGARANVKADNLVGSCQPSDCESPFPSADGCFCDDQCADFGDCCQGAEGAAAVCSNDECLPFAQGDSCAEGTLCNPGLCLANCLMGDEECCGPSQCVAKPAPLFCSDGTIVAGPSDFITSADGMECEMTSVHCITTLGACPLIEPPPPDFCTEGTIVNGPSSFIPSLNGMECEIPSLHCITNDMSDCPVAFPPPACENGSVVHGESSFLELANGMECEIPSIHCVTEDFGACPLDQ